MEEYSQEQIDNLIKDNCKGRNCPRYEDGCFILDGVKAGIPSRFIIKNKKLKCTYIDFLEGHVGKSRENLTKKR